MGKKKRRRIKKPEPDSSDEDGELCIWFYDPPHLNQPLIALHYFNTHFEKNPALGH